MASNMSRTPTPTAVHDAKSLAEMPTLETPLSSTIWHPMPTDGIPPYGPNVSPKTGLSILVVDFCHSVMVCFVNTL